MCWTAMLNDKNVTSYAGAEVDVEPLDPALVNDDEDLVPQLQNESVDDA